jgi:hypothetical protein
MRRLLPLLLLASSLMAIARPAAAQSLDDLELRKRRKQTTLGFGFLGLLDTSVGLNRDRPELTNILMVAPQLKIGDRMRVRFNFMAVRNWLDRQDNPWDLYDASLQFSHLGFWTEKHTGIALSGYARWYFPTSKLSRESGNIGQLRGVGKASRQLGPVYLSFELNLQKYFYRWTTWDTSESPGSDEWVRSNGRDGYIDNNASYGFGETFTAAVTALPGLDLSAIYGLMQTRPYQPDDAHSAASGSSYLESARVTNWAHSFRLVLDATYNLGALPPVARSARLKDSLLAKTFVSIGYYCLAPQLQNGHRDLNPFNPKYSYAYFDLMVVY